MDDLLPYVEAAFAVTGADTPGWPDPHPRGESPDEEEYSRVSDQGRYRILVSRTDAWARVLAERGLATTADVDPVWTRDVSRVRRVTPVAAGGLAVLVATTLLDGSDFGVEVALEDADGRSPVIDILPYCGCDACDDGSDLLLGQLDDIFRVALAGGVVHARSGEASLTRTPTGWSGRGEGTDPAWLDASIPAPGVRRWTGAPWT